LILEPASSSVEGAHKPWIRVAKWVIIGAVLFLILNALRHYSGEVKNHVTHINLRVLFAGYAL
jgi:hypothetical protein